MSAALPSVPRTRWTIGLALLVAGACLAVSVHFRDSVNASRQRLRLSVDPETLASLPPELAITQVALGSFRGLMVDYLWSRAGDLQEEAQYHEAVQMAEWITQLQPRFARVWSFQAWNLAYNVAITSPRPAERWQWVQAAVALLRDRAIPLNPTDYSLHRELCWLFTHKIGGDTDDSHYYYKDRLAREWEAVLGVPPDNDRVAWFAPVAQAASTGAELAALHPQLRPLTDWLASQAVSEIPRAALAVLTEAPAPPAFPRVPTLDPAAAAAWTAYLRATVLRQQYGMDPQLMLDLMNECGPFDWRLPDAHALYWITQGILRRVADSKAVRMPPAGDPSAQSIEARAAFYGHVNVSIAAKRLLLFGRLLHDPVRDFYLTNPDPRMLSFYERTVTSYEQTLPHAGEDSADAPIALENTLLDGLKTAYLYGDPEQAGQYLERLRARFSRGEDRSRRYALPLDELLVELTVARVESADDLTHEVQALLGEGLDGGLAVDRPDVSERCLKLAREVLERGCEKLSLAVLEFGAIEPLWEQTLRAFLASPARYASPQKKARVWAHLPADYRQSVPADVKLWLEAQAERSGLDAKTLFDG
ncbi:MAG: hypothetical protein AB7O52_17150 [Planctomycetota bacterium]